MKKCLLSIVVSLFLMACATLCGPQASQAAPGDYLFQWGTPHLFSSPGGLALDSSGNLYVADTGNNRIQVFDKNGTFLRKWGSYGSANGQFEYPVSLAVFGSLVYVLDENTTRVQVFDTSGNFIRIFGSYGTGNGQIEGPIGVATDKNGNVYLADSAKSQVLVFDSNGTFLRAVSGTFNVMLGLAVDSAGNIYVTDVNHGVQVFSSSGNLLRSWGYYGDGNTTFRVAVDGAGNVYLTESPFTDFGVEKVQVFDSSGNFLREWGSFGFDNGQFFDVRDIAIDASGNVYVTDQHNARVQVFNTGGTFLRKIGGTDADGQFDDPRGLATDSAGNVYVSDSGNHRVQVFDRAGTFLRKWGSFGAGDGQFANPSGLAVDGAGNVYVADNGGEIGHATGRTEVFDNNGTFLRKWSFPDSFYSATGGVAADGSGNIFEADFNENRIYVFDSAGTFLRQWGSYGSADGQFIVPYGVALDSTGNVYVADSDNNRIQVFGKNGNFIRAWGSAGTADGQLYRPNWIAIDSADNVYVGDGNQRVQVFSSAGAFLGRFGSAGTGNGQFSCVGGIAVSGSTVYVGDPCNDRVQAFAAFAGFNDQLPAGWAGRDIGSVGVPGHASYANGTFTLQGSGANIWGTTDAFHFVYLSLTGDGEVIARVTAVQNTNGYAKGGVMIRSSLAANAAHAMVDITPGYGAEFSRRLSAGASTAVNATAGITAPYWVKMARQGTTFTASISKDGVTWTPLGSASLSMGLTAYAGLIVNSHNNSVLCTATHDNVSVGGVTNIPAVTIVEPAQGASYTAPATVTVTGTARPSSGATIKQVDFYAGSTLIGTSASAPFSFNWNNVAAGDYQLTAKVIDSFGATVTSNPVYITVKSAGLPTPWLTQDVGSVGVAGSASFLNGNYTVKGSGANIYGTADAFRFVYQPITGDVTIVARVMSVQNTNTYAKAGVMIRQSLAANSAHAMMDITPTSGAEFSRRTTSGGSTTPTARTGIAAPYWVKLVRSGSTFTGSISSDGMTWSQVGSATISMTGTVYVGLIVNSHNNTVLCTGTFNNVAVTGVDVTPPTVTAFTIPSTSSSLTVPITTFTATDDHGVTGYLVTESSTKPAATASGWSAAAPTSYTFTTSGAKTLYAWAKDAAGNVSSSRSATVTITTGGLPSPWLTQDIGSVGVIGSASYLNGTFTLKGSGADIWGTADAFRFVYKVMTGDGQIIARVASVQNTNSYAKGGVMMRQSLSANSMHAMMDLRPTGGGEFSRRTSTGATTTATTRTGIAPPYWVRLVRSGNTFTGSVSSDGVTWSQVGSSTISMTSSIYVGLIVNSHSNSVLCTTNIDSVK